MYIGKPNKRYESEAELKQLPTTELKEAKAVHEMQINTISKILEERQEVKADVKRI